MTSLWTTYSDGSNNAWNSVAQGQLSDGTKMYVAVSQTNFMRSTNGVSWTVFSPPITTTVWQSVTFGTDASGNKLFVVVSIGSKILTSTDGINWTQRTGLNFAWNRITYGTDPSGNGIFVAVGDGGGIQTSYNSVNWSLRSISELNNWTGITFGNGLFVATANNGTHRAATSSNGITWTVQTAASPVAWRNLTYGQDASGNGIYVAATTTTTNTNQIMTSSNGSTWTLRSSAVNNSWRDITYGNGLFVAVSNKSAGRDIMVSTDAINWSSGESTTTDASWNAITYGTDLSGNGLFVALASSGTGNRLMTAKTIQPTFGTFLISDKTFGDASFNITPPSTNSAGTFSYTSSNTSVATVSGNTLTIVGAGSTTITATQAATASYAPKSITTTFTVNRANPTIGSFSFSDKTYGDAPFTIVGPTTTSNGDITYSSSNTAIITIDNTVATIVGVGSLGITFSQTATTNYNAATSSATLTVNRATTVITGFTMPTDKVFGDASFNILDPSSNSAGAYSYISSNTAVATISGNAVTIVGAGTSTITCNQAISANFTAGTTTASFTVAQALPTFGTFTVPTDKVFGNAPFSLTPPTSTNNDVLGTFSYASSDTSIATISSDVLTIVGAGSSCAITATQAATTNYLTRSVVASFSVAKAVPSISSLSLPSDKTFGDGSFNILDPSSNSAGAYTYASSDTAVATISGNTITIVGAGTTLITGSQAATANYVAKDVSANLVIAKKTPTLGSFSVPSDKAYLDAPFLLVAPTSDSSGNFTFSSSDTNVATVSSDILTIIGAGTTTITVSQAMTDNYLASAPLTAYLTISKIYPSFGAYSVLPKTYGDPSFNLEDPSTNNNEIGFTFSSNNDAVASVIGRTVSINGAGTCYLYANQAETANFFATSQYVEFTVNKLLPTLSNFSIAQKVLGTSPFIISDPSSNSVGTFSYSSSDTNVASVSGSTITINGIGTTTIQAYQNETDNYLSKTISTDLTVVQSSASDPVQTSTVEELAYFLESPAQYTTLSSSILITQPLKNNSNTTKIITTDTQNGIQLASI